MGRKKLYSEQERQERVNQQRKEYYQRNKEKIAEKYRLRRMRELGLISPDEKPLTRLLKKWNEQLYQHMQENLPQWLEKALKLQININTQFINQHEQKQGI